MVCKRFVTFAFIIESVMLRNFYADPNIFNGYKKLIILGGNYEFKRSLY